MIKFPDAYTMQEVAEMLECSKWTVNREVKAGRLRAEPRKGTTKPLYIKQEWLDEWKEAQFDA